MNRTDLVAFGVTAQTPDTRFLASLSDGTTVIQDERPGEVNAWFRLGDYLKANPGLKITCLRLQMPGIPDIVMPSGQPGYFFGKKGMLANLVIECHWVGVGYYDGQVAVINWHCASNHLSGQVEERTKEQCGFFLIENPA